MPQRQEETVGEIKHVVKGQEHQHAPCQTKASLARYYADQRPAFENIGFITEQGGHVLVGFSPLGVLGPLSLKLGATVGSQNENDEHGHAR
jgi:hypothetical protein